MTSVVYATAPAGTDPDTEPVLASAADVVLAVDQGGPSDPNDPRIRYALRAASSRFRNAVEHPVHRVTGDTVALDGDGTSIVRLPVVNMTATEVRVDGRVIPPSDYRITRAGLLRFHRAHVAVDALVEVDGDHGFELIPGGIRQAVVDLAARIAVIPIGAKQMNLGSAQISYGTDVGTTQQWAEAVERYRIGGRA